MSDVKELNINNTTYDIKAKTVVDNNGTKLSMWSGTKQEYDNIVTKDPNQLYFIEDDTDVTFQLLDLIYPIGSIYIGTMSVCPLQTLGLGTWQLVAQDRVLQGAGTRGSVGDTLNESLPNIKGGAQFGSIYNVSYPYAITSANGAFYGDNLGLVANVGGNNVAGYNSYFNFDASRSSSTYQNNAPVQQDAYLVNIWERIS